MPITDLIQELMIIKGLPPAPGDTTTVEQPMVSLDLMAMNNSGWCLEAEEGWNPIIPSLKGGGVWADSAVSSGRQLLSNEEANVVETMHLTVTGTTAIDLATNMMRMGRMIQDARDFWATHWQIEPVYIRWLAKGAPGPQYALIYNIEMAIVEPDTYSDHIRDVTITIEREPYWRPIPPGANPKLWTAYFHGDDITTADDLYLGARGLTYTNARNNLFQTDTLENSREWNVGQTGVTSENYIDIPAADIPGDAPALVNMVIENPNAVAGGVYVGRQTKDTTAPGRDGVNNTSVLVLNAGDIATLGSDATIAADTGAPNSNNQATGQRGVVTFVTTTLVPRFRWRAQGTNSPETRTDLTLQRGQYAAFLRARLSAAGNVGLQLQYGANDLTNLILNPIVVLDETVGTSGTGNTASWAVLYMGTVNIPWNSSRASVGADGKGLLVLPSTTSFTNMSIILAASRLSGTPVFYVADLVLIPFDECMIGLAPTSAGFLGTTGAVIYDNTGYFTHGQLNDYGMYWRYQAADPAATEEEAAEILGGQFTLMPAVANRLHFFYTQGSPPVSVVKSTGHKVYLNIVPRWRYIRDK